MKPRSLALALLLLAACGGGSPAAPTRTTPVLHIDQKTTLIVARHETGQLHALFGAPGSSPQDVTTPATWTSSNPAVVSIDAGTVQTVNIGQASVTVEYQGQTATLPVTVRRRTEVTGKLQLRDANDIESILALLSYVDGRNLGWHGASDWANDVLDVDFGPGIDDPAVDPGPHEISVRVSHWQGAYTYVTDASSYVNVIDRDTKQVLKVIPLPVRVKTLSGDDDIISWTVQVDVFSS